MAVLVLSIIFLIYSKIEGKQKCKILIPPYSRVNSNLIEFTKKMDCFSKLRKKLKILIS